MIRWRELNFKCVVLLNYSWSFRSRWTVKLLPLIGGRLGSTGVIFGSARRSPDGIMTQPLLGRSESPDGKATKVLSAPILVGFTFLQH